MLLRILSIALLLSVCPCTQGRHPVMNTVPLCCTKVSSTNVSQEVKGTPYRQKASRKCVSALIFNLQEGGKICVDPEAEWALKYVKKDKMQ